MECQDFVSVSRVCQDQCYLDCRPARHGVEHYESNCFIVKMLPRRMLSKEDEATGGGEDTEVRREDQDKINRFSRLHNKESVLEDDLKAKQVSVPSGSNPSTSSLQTKKVTRKTKKTWKKCPASLN